MNTCSLINITSIFRTLIGRHNFGNEGPRNAKKYQTLLPARVGGAAGHETRAGQLFFFARGEGKISLHGFRFACRNLWQSNEIAAAM